MIEAILPPSVASAWTTDASLDAPLYREEALALGRAVEKRRREFVTGRACARQALARLGLPPRSVPSGPRGEPVWPQGVVGSITHCRGYVACAVASDDTLGAIGIDAEPHAGLSEDMVREILTAAEIRRLNDLCADVHWERVSFSAKEALYKAWFALTGRSLGFHDVELTLDGAGDRFVAQLRTPGASFSRFEGRWLVRDGLTLTAVVVPRSGARGPGGCCTSEP